MRHPFHKYISYQLEEGLRKRSVLVFYDPRREFAPFIGSEQRPRRMTGLTKSALGASQRALSATRSRSSRSAPKSSHWWSWICRSHS